MMRRRKNWLQNKGEEAGGKMRGEKEERETNRLSSEK